LVAQAKGGGDQHLNAENRLLRERLGGRRIISTDAERPNLPRRRGQWEALRCCQPLRRVDVEQQQVCITTRGVDRPYSFQMMNRQI
jgi:hypothetical protein